MWRLLAVGGMGALAMVASTPHTAKASLSLEYQFSGTGNWSIDGVGSNRTPVGSISAVVPVGSTVQRAYLYSTMYSFSGPFAAPSVDFDGTTYSGGSWTNLGQYYPDPSATGFMLGAFRTDVTSQVASKVGGGAAAPFSFQVNSESPNDYVDGEALVVIYSNPAEMQRTIAVLDGFSSSTGDSTTFNFAAPVDTTISGFEALMSLGIGFGWQGSDQYSIVDGNGRLLTTSAGGYDDGVETNGGLITIGGIGDSSANPDPNALPSGPFTDDELYDLAQGNVDDATPYILNGDTSFTLVTRNPSLDDNIFFMGLNVTAAGQVVPGPPGVIPEPSTFIIWSLLGAFGFTLGWWRRRRAA
jgi:hypothetical protein